MAAERDTSYAVFISRKTGDSQQFDEEIGVFRGQETGVSG